MAELLLRNGGVTIVDDQDLERLSAYTWVGHVMRSGRRYAMTNADGKRLYLHRFVIGASPDMEVDHINGDPLDNRRCNLREVTHAHNQQNRRCGYGVTGHRNVYRLWTGRFQVKLRVNGQNLSFGVYDTVEEAATVARAARAAHMPFSVE